MRSQARAGCSRRKADQASFSSEKSTVAPRDQTLADLVAHVYVHELAHHFGWSDDEIARIDQWWT
jgi:hypothetical protein